MYDTHINLTTFFTSIGSKNTEKDLKFKLQKKDTLYKYYISLWGTNEIKSRNMKNYPDKPTIFSLLIVLDIC